MHLVWPDIRALHRVCGCGNGGIDIALVDQRAWLRWIGAERRLEVLQIGQCWCRLPGSLELRRRLDCVFLALGNDTDEIADPDHGDQSRNMADRGLIDCDQTGADKRASIDAGIRRAHDAAVKHAGHANIVHIDRFAGRLCRQVDARYRLPYYGVRIYRLDLDVIGQFEPDSFAADQLAIADATIVFSAHQAILHGSCSDGSSRRSAARAVRK